MRRANEIKILGTNEQRIKDGKDFLALTIPFNLNQLSSLFMGWRKMRVIKKIKKKKTSPIISIFTDFVRFF